MPYMSPLYFQPPMEYRDNWSQHVTFRSDPKVIARVMPKPLVPDPNGTMFLLTSYFFATGFGHYRESTLCALAKFRGKPVNYTLFLMLNNDMERLLSIFYRIDISEVTFKAILSQASPDEIPTLLAKEVIKREMQKVETRLKYRE